MDGWIACSHCPLTGHLFHSDSAGETICHTGIMQFITRGATSRERERKGRGKTNKESLPPIKTSKI